MEKYKDTIIRVKPIADQFIQENNITYPISNPLQMLADLGYYVIKAEAPENLSGFYMKKDRFPFIFVNSTHSLGRQNFSLWHEVYHHYMNHENGISDFNSKSIEEREAEIFSGCIMLPDREIKKLAVKPIDIEFIASVSASYQMSFNAVAVRFMQEQYISYETYQEMSKLSAVENAEILHDLYEKQSLSADILKPTNDIKISENIMQVLSDNYESGKAKQHTVNEIIGRIEGLKNV